MTKKEEIYFVNRITSFTPMGCHVPSLPKPKGRISARSSLVRNEGTWQPIGVNDVMRFTKYISSFFEPHNVVHAYGLPRSLVAKAEGAHISKIVSREEREQAAPNELRE